jgi:hypothetical protein
LVEFPLLPKAKQILRITAAYMNNVLMADEPSEVTGLWLEE